MKKLLLDVRDSFFEKTINIILFVMLFYLCIMINHVSDQLSEDKVQTKTYCYEMESCTEAKYYLEKFNIKNLDKDNDGIPCESICKK